jgi:hypothetical protein
MRKVILCLGALVLMTGLGFYIHKLINVNKGYSYLHEQEAYLNDLGYLVGDQPAIGFYSEASAILKANNITNDTIRSLGQDDLCSETIIQQVVPLCMKGAQQVNLGISAPVWDQDSVQVDDHVYMLEDIRCVGRYLARVLEYQAKGTDLGAAHACFAMGVQLSRYKNELFNVCGMACRDRALKWLIGFYSKSEDQEKISQMKKFQEEVSSEFDRFRKRGEK